MFDLEFKETIIYVACFSVAFSILLDVAEYKFRVTMVEVSCCVSFDKLGLVKVNKKVGKKGNVIDGLKSLVICSLYITKRVRQSTTEISFYNVVTLCIK